MSGKAYQNVGECSSNNIIADSVHPVDTKQVILAAGTGKMAKWSLINKEGKLCNKVSQTLDVPVGVLCEEVILDSSATTNSIMYTSGSLYADQIIVGTDVEITDFTEELRKLGIYLR